MGACRRAVGGRYVRAMTVLYPVAKTAQAALDAPLGRAAREREAARRAEGEVRFVTEAVGPAFSSREAALDAWPGRLDDDRKGKGPLVLPEDRFCTLREVLSPVKGRRPRVVPAKPVFANGRRWPEPTAAALETQWRLSVSYWKVVDPAEEARRDTAPGQARSLRTTHGADDLDARALRAMAQAPLQPVKPQQPLDIGLFEARAPENPSLVLPDE